MFAAVAFRGDEGEQFVVGRILPRGVSSLFGYDGAAGFRRVYPLRHRGVLANSALNPKARRSIRLNDGIRRRECLPGLLIQWFQVDWLATGEIATALTDSPPRVSKRFLPSDFQVLRANCRSGLAAPKSAGEATRLLHVAGHALESVCRLLEQPAKNPAVVVAEGKDVIQGGKTMGLAGLLHLL